MVLTAGGAKYRQNKDLYNALLEGEQDRVIQLCRQNPEGPLHTLTIHNDTVLHMAVYSKQKDLVLNLLKELPEEQFNKLAQQNEIGNTVLHEAATSNRIVPAAREMLLKAPNLLSMHNRRGETALFRAARYGKNRMFEFLDDEVNTIVKNEADLRAFHYRNDKTSILHMAVITEHFDLALLIASKYEYLLGEKDGDGMTALQLLACNPSAFKSGSTRRSLIRRLIYSCISTQDTTMTDEEEVETCCTAPLWKSIRMEKSRYDSVVKLAKFLIERDTSWEETESALDLSRPRTHKYTSKTSQRQRLEVGQKAPTTQDVSPVKIAQTALFLATKVGIIEIVEEILTMYPEAVEHVDDEGRNILHVAIKYRQIQVFDFVLKMGVPMMRLIRKLDNQQNSILHYVAIKVDNQGEEDMRSPVLLLQEDLILFERVKQISTAHFVKHFNSEGKTAETLFTETNKNLREDAKDWVKRTAENCSIVAVLIATVAFAAAYTVPGGPNQDTGYPLLYNQSFFVIFTLTDVLSLTLALTSVIVFLSILTSPFRLKDFKRSLPQKLMLGITLLILSVSFMMLAFAATILLMIHNNENWTRVALYAVALFPVGIFAISYLPLYVSLMKSFKHTIKKIGDAFPRFNCVPRQSSTTAPPVKLPKSQAKIPSNPSQSLGCCSTCHYLEIE